MTRKLETRKREGIGIQNRKECIRKTGIGIMKGGMVVIGRMSEKWRDMKHAEGIFAKMKKKDLGKVGLFQYNRKLEKKIGCDVEEVWLTDAG